MHETEIMIQLKNRALQMKALFRRRKKYRISYSQCGEDLIIEFIFESLGVKKPSYIDIGAHDPYYLSNTALFYTKGSRGINIEPDPVLFAELYRVRKRDTNLNIGMGETLGEAPFYIMSVPTLNTFSREQAESLSLEGSYFIRSERRIKIDTLPNVIETYCNGQFPDFLTLDAEGMEDVLLQSLNNYANGPVVICVETISFSEKGLGKKNANLIQFLHSKGYMTFADTYINTIFVKKDKWIGD